LFFEAMLMNSLAERWRTIGAGDRMGAQSIITACLFFGHKEEFVVAGLMEEFRSEVEKIFGEDLVSLTIYGAHAADEPPGREENVSVLVVVRALRREELSAYRNIAHRYARRGIPAPPIFTEGFLKESSDVFPLEFLGMASQRRVIFGKDIVPELNITTRNLRHQVEFELKGKLLTLRRMYMEVFGNRELVALLKDTVGSVVSVARGLLLLSDREAPQEKIAILDGIEKHFGVALPAIREVIAARQGGKIPHSRAEDLFFSYQGDVERLCSLVDEYPMETAR
jgi:hypothetical protein